MTLDFASQITGSQQRLYAYIRSLLDNSAAAWDVVQRRKQVEFTQGTKFDAWAFTVARFQVLAWLRDRKREPLDVITEYPKFPRSTLQGRKIPAFCSLDPHASEVEWRGSYIGNRFRTGIDNHHHQFQQFRTQAFSATLPKWIKRHQTSSTSAVVFGLMTSQRLLKLPLLRAI
ncbi:hypothetical protein [Prosthecobacter sp.]|uniref:hypothetical protein n=1 Tax=Prosthecobacter sp. TaxID=1965333 RepID=UPI001D5837D2|nr:hypothetical protein [Prosthecobacter sp.]MCB1274951.1 hypothetical protein [Prosthecobacter sp.]